MRRWVPVFVDVVSTLLIFLVADRMLGILGFPSDTPFQEAHPPGKRKLRRNIEFEYEFATNELGLRGRPLATPKPLGETRILLLGDSFTEGYGVAADETMDVELGRRHSGVRFVNGGFSGQGPVQYWRLLRGLGESIDPDGIVVLLYANDVADTPLTLKRDALLARAPARTGLDARLQQVAPRLHALGIGALKRAERKWRKRGGFLGESVYLARRRGVSEASIRRWSASMPTDLVAAADRDAFNGKLLYQGLVDPDYWKVSLDLAGERGARKYAAVEMILEEIVSYGRALGAEIGLVYVPAPFQYDPRRLEPWNPWWLGGVESRPEWTVERTRLQQRLGDWASRHEVPFLDLTEPLRAEVRAGATLNYRLDGHWKPAGQRAAAAAIDAWLRREPVLAVLTRPQRPPVSGAHSAVGH